MEVGPKNFRMHPFVSVIVPTFNRADLVTRAMNSVKAQDFKDWELIVVDDGSTDVTFDVVSAWQAQHPKLRVRFERLDENRGVSGARNYAARLAQGDWLAFLDSDDEWLPQKLSRQLALADRFSLIHGEEIWIRNGVRVNPMKKHAKGGGRLFRRCVELCCISPSTALLHRDLFAELGGFREDFPVCEDYELWLRVCARGEVGFVSDPVIVKYGGHEDQLSRRYKAMDYYRVKALLPFLDSPMLSEDEREVVRLTLLQKSEILINGYRKHGSSATTLAEVEAVLRQVRLHDFGPEL